MSFKPLPLKPDFPAEEEAVLQFWKHEKIFERSVTQAAKGDPFVFFEGPPTANGRPGLHHVEARAFKDVILRYQAMRGKKVVRKAGWDTHGLPVEIEVEKSLNISGKKDIESLVPGSTFASIEKFNKLCRENVWKYKDEWERFTERIGFWLDLKHPYVTYERDYIESVWAVLRRMWDRSVDKEPLIYRGHKVLPYCARCGTALSSHEVAQGYRSVEDNSVYVKFRLLDRTISTRDTRNRPVVVKLEGPVYLLSWTTTPWTLPGNVALAVAESVEYAIVKTSGANYILASSLTEEVLKEPFTVLQKVFGRDLAGLRYEPLFSIKQLKAPTAYRVYPGDFVTTQEGTGIVHTAVMYGDDDYKLGTALDLPKFHTVDPTGRFIKDLGELSGREVKSKDTEKHILHHLRKTGTLYRELPHRHDYPFCWRCGTPLLYYARDSWFIRMSALSKELVENNRQIAWVPDYIKEGRFGGWLSEIKDWAISRERYWGTPLPFWRCEKCGEYECIGSVKALQEKALSRKQKTASKQKKSANNLQLTADSLQLDKLDLHRPYVDQIVLVCEKCGGQSHRVPEVLDVWFDSGAMPYAQWHYPFENEKIFAEQYPADYISEAIDQTRGWFYTLLAIATALGETRPPYKNVICLGHILDSAGQKMSKSKGNVVKPSDLIPKYGADILRWYMFSINQPGAAKAFSAEDLVRLQRRVQLILWNVVNYFVTYANAQKWTPNASQAGSSAEDSILDRWISARLNEVTLQVNDNLSAYDVFRAARSLELFIEDLSTWYLRRSRGRSEARFFGVFYDTLSHTVRLLAPFMPFYAERLFQTLKGAAGEVSVHLAVFPQARKMTEEQRNELAIMEQVRKIAETVLAARKSKGLKVRQPLASLVIAQANAQLEPYLYLLSDELNFIDVRVAKEAISEPGLEKLEKDFAGYSIYWDPRVTPELKARGIARELERQVQEFRRRSGLMVGERAALFYETKSQAVYEAFEFFDSEKTYIERIIGVREKTDFKTTAVIEGHEVWLGLKRQGA